MRTNPNDQSPNPCKRWYSWAGDKGCLKYYDKEIEKEIYVDLPFEFVLLDRLATVRGWHDPSESNIYSNEIRSTVNESLTVRAFKMKEPIARGFYADIKDKVKAAGGKFNTNLYVAFTGDSDSIEIGSVMLHGASLAPWFEFEKTNRKELFHKGVRITEYEEGQKGGVKFRKPVFELIDIPQELEDKAGDLQMTVTDYLTKYLARGEPNEVKDKTLSDLQEAKEQDQKDDNDEIPF